MYVVFTLMVQVSRENTKLSYDLISNDKIIFSVCVFVFYLICWFRSIKVTLSWCLQVCYSICHNGLVELSVLNIIDETNNENEQSKRKSKKKRSASTFKSGLVWARFTLVYCKTTAHVSSQRVITRRPHCRKQLKLFYKLAIQQCSEFRSKFLLKKRGHTKPIRHRQIHVKTGFSCYSQINEFNSIYT